MLENSRVVGSLAKWELVSVPTDLLPADATPAAGSVTEVGGDNGITRLSLGNSIQVLHMQTDHQKDSILFDGE